MGKENFVLTHGGKARRISWWEHSSSSVRECIRLIIEAGLDWSLITEPEISEKIDEETQTRSITIVLNNSPYLQGTFFKVDDTIVLNVLKTFTRLSSALLICGRQQRQVNSMYFD